MYTLRSNNCVLGLKLQSPIITCSHLKPVLHTYVSSRVPNNYTVKKYTFGKNEIRVGVGDRSWCGRKKVREQGRDVKLLNFEHTHAGYLSMPYPATVPSNRAQQPCPATVSSNRTQQPYPATVPSNRAQQPYPATVPSNRAQQPHLLVGHTH